jgi:hypothetical protein
MTKDEYLEYGKDIEMEAIRKIDETMASLKLKFPADTKNPTYKRAEKSLWNYKA